jgi:DNA-binding NarL/FixJ family response regulator
MSQKAIIKVGLVDDHVLMRKSLAGFVNSIAPYQVILEAANGKELMEMLSGKPRPDILLLDINMPVISGFETALAIKRDYPEIRIMALSMYDIEHSVFRMLRNEACGYVLKDMDPAEFRIALDNVMEKGVYYVGAINSKVKKSIEEGLKASHIFPRGRELEFLQYICTELTYKEIADRMFVSPRTVDSYRDNLFQRYGIHTRVGLVLFAIRNGFVNL